MPRISRSPDLLSSSVLAREQGASVQDPSNLGPTTYLDQWQRTTSPPRTDPTTATPSTGSPPPHIPNDALLPMHSCSHTTPTQKIDVCFPLDGMRSCLLRPYRQSESGKVCAAKVQKAADSRDLMAFLLGAVGSLLLCTPLWFSCLVAFMGTQVLAIFIYEKTRM